MHLRLLLFCCLREDMEVSEEDIGKTVRQEDLGRLVHRAALLHHELQQEMLQLRKDLFPALPPPVNSPTTLRS